MYSAAMSLLPEQVKAREYLDQQGSRRSAAQIAERVVASFTAIEEFLDAVSEAEAAEVLRAAPDRPTDARAPVVMVINVKREDGSLGPVHWIENLDWKAYGIIFRLHVLDHLNQAKKV